MASAPASFANILPLVQHGSSSSSAPLRPHIHSSNLFACSLPSRLHLFNYIETRRSRDRNVIVAMATGESAEPSNGLTETLKSLQDAWDKTDDKLAVGGLGFAALLVLWASTGLVGAIDKLPLVPTVFEFVGILFSGWFVYRYLLFKPDREELLKVIEDTASKITGSES